MCAYTQTKRTNTTAILLLTILITAILANPPPPPTNLRRPTPSSPPPPPPQSKTRQTQLSCQSSLLAIKISITTDAYPEETSWTLTPTSSPTTTILEGKDFNSRNHVYTKETFLCDDDCYRFTLLDSHGDGLGSSGFYRIWYGGVLMEHSDGEGDREFTDYLVGDLIGGGCPSAMPSMTNGPSVSPSEVRWSGEIEVLEGHENTIHAVRFAPGGGEWVVSASYDLTIRVWGLKGGGGGEGGGGEVQKVTGHTDWITSLDWSRDRTMIVSGSADDTARVWDVVLGEDVVDVTFRSVLPHGSSVLSVAFSPDGMWVATGGYDDLIKIWSVAGGGNTGGPVLWRTFVGHSSYVTSLSYHPDGKTLASGSFDTTIRLWDVDGLGTWGAVGGEAGPLGTFADHVYYVRSVDWSPDGGMVASGSGDTTVKLWNYREDGGGGGGRGGLTLEGTLLGHTAYVNSVRFSPTGKYLASGSSDHQVIIWNIHGRRADYGIAKTFYGHTGPVEGVDISADGFLVVSGGIDRTVRVWGMACGPDHWKCPYFPPVAAPVPTIPRTSSPTRNTTRRPTTGRPTRNPVVPPTKRPTKSPTSQPTMTVLTCENDGVLTPVIIDVITDFWPEDTSWAIQESPPATTSSGTTPTTTVVLQRDSYPYYGSFRERYAVCSNSCYRFFLYDAGGDGLCCEAGYALYYNGVLVARGGGNFGVRTYTPLFGGGCPSNTPTLITTTATGGGGEPSSDSLKPSRRDDDDDDDDDDNTTDNPSRNPTVFRRKSPTLSPVRISAANTDIQLRPVGKKQQQPSSVPPPVHPPVWVIGAGRPTPVSPPPTVSSFSSPYPSSSSSSSSFVTTSPSTATTTHHQHYNTNPLEYWSSTPLDTLRHTDSVLQIRFSPHHDQGGGGEWLISASNDGKVNLWSVLLGRRAVQTFSVETGFSPKSLDFINVDDGGEGGGGGGGGGMKVVCGLSGGSENIKVYNFNIDDNLCGSLELSYQLSADNFYAMAVSPDGMNIASGGYDYKIRVWNAEMGRGGGLVRTLVIPMGGGGGVVGEGREASIIGRKRDGDDDAPPPQAILCLEYSPDGKTLISSIGPELILWYLNDGGLVIGGIILGTYIEHQDDVRSLRFSPDGTRLASGSDDETVRVWDVINSTALVIRDVLTGHRGGVGTVQWSQDGKYLASGSEDGTIRLYLRNDDDEQYRLIETFQGHNGPINSIDFAPPTTPNPNTTDPNQPSPGLRLASASSNNTVHIWGTLCPPGQYGSHSSCRPCPPGKYQPEPRSSACLPCPPGTAQGLPGAVSCKVCRRGTYMNVEGGVRCEECRRGGFCDNGVGDGSCDGGWRECPVGTFGGGVGMFREVDACLVCPVGTYSNNRTGLESCFPCPQGTYQNLTGSPSCHPCPPHTHQSRQGQSSCSECPPGSHPDQYGITCIRCPHRLASATTTTTLSDSSSKGNQNGKHNVDSCPFCDEGYYLRNTGGGGVPTQRLMEHPERYCLPCPDNIRCGVNTTIETLQNEIGFWRDSIQTEVFYRCNNVSGVCLAGGGGVGGGPSCASGHGGVKCEVCTEAGYYFDDTEGRCMPCTILSNIAWTALIVVGFFVLFFLTRYIIHERLRRLWLVLYEPFIGTGLQAKIKILVSFYQVVVALGPVYGVHVHDSFQWWFGFLEITDFGMGEVFGIPGGCWGSVTSRIMVVAFWPYFLGFLLVVGNFVYTIAVDVQLSEWRRDSGALNRFLYRSFHSVIIVFYFLLPSVCRQIFDGRTCQSFTTDDSTGLQNSYLAANWTVRCNSSPEDPDYESSRLAFTALLILWPIATPIVFFLLLLTVRPSVQSKQNPRPPLTYATRFLWSDYRPEGMWWEVVDLVRKIILTSSVLWIDSEEGAERILRLIVGSFVCVVYGTVLSRVRPYRKDDDSEFAIVGNLILTCCFLLGIVIHECSVGDGGEDGDGGNRGCRRLFGLSDSYTASALVFILTVSMLIAFILLIVLLRKNGKDKPTVCLVSTRNTPNLDLPGGCEYHLFVSHIWANQRKKVHKMVQTFEMYLPGVKIWWRGLHALMDVDVLENIAGAAHFVLFYSKGFFRFANCRREVAKAMEAKRPITVMFQHDDISVDIFIQMKMEFIEFWTETSPNVAAKYIFGDKPVMWISGDIRFLMESVKIVAGRLLKGLPYYQKNSILLDAGMTIDGEIKFVEMLTPLDILYCSSNDRAQHLALKVAEECIGDVSAREINLSDTNLQQDNRRAVMLVYLNNKTFQDSNVALCDSIKRSIDGNIELVLVHENDTDKGGCAFSEITNQTPEQLMEPPYSMYSTNTAVRSYSIKEYEKVTIHKLLVKMGGKSIGKRHDHDLRCRLLRFPCLKSRKWRPLSTVPPSTTSSSSPTVPATSSSCTPTTSSSPPPATSSSCASTTCSSVPSATSSSLPPATSSSLPPATSSSLPSATSSSPPVTSSSLPPGTSSSLPPATPSLSTPATSSSSLPTSSTPSTTTGNVAAKGTVATESAKTINGFVQPSPSAEHC